MFRSTFIRLSLGLTLLTCSILAGLDLVGVVPRMTDGAAEARIQLCESLALQSLMATDRNDYGSVRSLLEGAVRRNEDLLSAGMRSSGGRIFVATRQHKELWKPESDTGSTATHARIPLVRKGKQWATIEVRFADAAAPGVLAGLWARPLIKLLVPLAIIAFCAYAIYLKRTLKHLDPSAVIPPRVQAAFDVMSEGVLLLDQDEQIILVNTAFAERFGQSRHSLLGLRASALAWRVPVSLKPAQDLPWLAAIEHSRVETGRSLSITTEAHTVQTFMVNAAPVGDEKGKTRGAIVTFDDMTELERKRAELEAALAELEKSRDETRLQNEELQVLARTDPLTGIANRRSFMEVGEALIKRAQRQDRNVCCVMADIDHFKRVNDEHGHSMGDDVICLFASAFAAQVADRDLACRYGGEEFCLLVPDLEIDEATELAERVRRTVNAKGFAPIDLSASFGVVSMRAGAPRLYELIGQADEALYAAKQAGRNRVSRWDQLTR